MLKTVSTTSSDKPEQSLKDELVKMGLDPKGLETGLVLPTEKKAWLKELVSEHLARHGVSVSSGRITASDGVDDEVLFIDGPSGPTSAATPALVRIAAGIKKHHNGARLAVDVTGEIVKRDCKGAFNSFSNTIVVPWSLVIDPSSVRASETFGHELIHLKQLSDGRSGIAFQPIGSLSTNRGGEWFHSCEVEAHLFNLRRAFRRFPDPNNLSVFPSAELKELLQIVASEAKDISEYCRLLKTALPLLQDAIADGEPFVCLRKSSDSPISRWGIVIGRDSDAETLAVFEIRNDSHGNFWRSLQANLDECKHVLNAHDEQCRVIRDEARSALASHLKRPLPSLEIAGQ